MGGLATRAIGIVRTRIHVRAIKWPDWDLVLHPQGHDLLG